MNGEAVTLGADGSFSTALTLSAGANTVTIVATDKAGNTTSAKRTVSYTAPVSQLSLAVTNPAQDITTRNVIYRTYIKTVDSDDDDSEDDD